jgi:hypothetical protein
MQLTEIFYGMCELKEQESSMTKSDRDSSAHYHWVDPQRTESLAGILINNADGPSVPIGSIDHGTTDTCEVEVVFRNLEQRLIDEIERWPRVYGCVAWLTSRPVLAALAKKDAVGIIVQKEDFLRPDSMPVSLRYLYGALPSGDRSEVLGHIYNYAGDQTTEPVRCMGNHNTDRVPAWPRMHNKFLVFCDYKKVPNPHFDPNFDENQIIDEVVARKVWAGSYNMTFNATSSLENATIITSNAIAKAYLEEFGLILGASEPLNWQSKWVAPEYRMGS